MSPIFNFQLILFKIEEVWLVKIFISMRRRNNEIEDEEIDSDEIPDVNDSDSTNDESDNFFAPESVDEIKLRKAEEHRKYILAHQVSDEEDIEEILIKESEEKAGTRFDEIHIEISKKFPNPERFRAHDGFPTCIVIGPNQDYIFSASKDCKIIQVSITGQRKKNIIGTASKPIISLAYNPVRKLLAAGSEDNLITIYDIEGIAPPLLLKGHRGPVTGLAFNNRGIELFSCSKDMNVRVWDVTNGNILATLYGHQEEVLGIDYCNVLVTCGADRSIRLWKYLEEKQLLFQSSSIRSPIECISLFNNKMCVTGSQDGKLCLWDLSRKKPLCVVKNAHGAGNWISAVAAMRFRKLFASGSCDGFVRFWEVHDNKIFEVFKVELSGYVNDLKFSEKGDFIAVQLSHEQKLGRWLPPIHSKQGVYIIRFDSQGKLSEKQ